MEFDNDEFEEFEEFEQISRSQYNKRLLPIIKRLKSLNNESIPQGKVYKILFEELSKYGVISRSGLRDYYRNLRDLGIIQELGKQKVKNEEGIEEITKVVKINLKAIENIDFFHEALVGFKCKICGKQFENKAEYIEHQYTHKYTK